MPQFRLAALAALTGLAAAGSASAQYAGELKERLRAPVVENFTTPKKPYDLEICLADVITSVGYPIVLRDGPRDVVIAAALSPSKYMASFSLRDVPAGTQIEMRLMGRGWDERFRSRVRDCL